MNRLLPTALTVNGIRRTAGLWGCAVLAVAAHGIALDLLDTRGPQMPAGQDFGGSFEGSIAPKRVAIRTIVEANPAVALASVTRPLLPGSEAATGKLKPRRHVATASAGATVEPARPPLPPVVALTDPPEAPVAAPAHFYSFDEVELPAAPVSDWQLDAAALDSARIERLVFDLFVSDEGAVVGCAILEPAALDDGLRAALEARLRTTPLLPAVRTGRAVPSVRRIELTVS